MICWDKIYGWYHLKWGVGISFAFARLSDHIMCSMFCAISLSPTPTRTPPHATLFFHFLPQNCQCCNYYCHLLHLVVLVSFKRRACSLGRVWPINGQNLPTESGLWGWTFVSFGVLVHDVLPQSVAVYVARAELSPMQTRVVSDREYLNCRH